MSSEESCHGNARNNKPPTVFSSLLVVFAAPRVKPLENAPVFMQNIAASVGAVLSQNAKPCRKMAGYAYSFISADSH